MKTRVMEMVVEIGTGMVVAALVLLAGCAGLPQYPECNAHYPQDAKIVQVANTYEMCLRDVGNAMIVANALAVGMDAYTVEDALKVVDDTILLLETNVTEMAFRDHVMGRLTKFPGLVDVGRVYVMEFSSTRFMDRESKGIIRGWLEEKVRPVLVASMENNPD
jgi:hypothetical protein